MGFDPARVDWAIHATTGRGLQPAMDHVLANQDNPIPDYKNAPAASSGGKAGSDEVRIASLLIRLAATGTCIELTSFSSLSSLIPCAHTV